MKTTWPKPAELGDQILADPRGAAIMEELRKLAANRFGVTVVGPYMTLRFGVGQRLVQVSFQVTSITDSTIPEETDDEEK